MCNRLPEIKKNGDAGIFPVYRSELYSVPSNIRIGPTDANAFRGHRLTIQKGYTYAAYKTRNIFLKKTLGS